MAMMGYGLGTGAGILYFALIAFIFSVIFWLTYNWLVKDRRKR